MELKISILIILLGITSAYAGKSYSQTAKVSLDMNNTTLEEVMDEIERQSEFYFIFNQKQVDINRRVDIQVENKLISDILQDLFRDTEVKYAILDRKILLTSELLDSDLKLLKGNSSIPVEVQQPSISGKVTDASGNPIAGVTVTVEGTSIGAITDVEGKYSVSGISSDAVLKFSFIGMITQDIKVDRQNVIDVVLQDDVIGLEEVVVVGYGTQTKATLSGATAFVKSEDLVISPTPTAGQALVGKAAGIMTRMADGRPGRGTYLQIRKFGTPLYVIDGIQSTEDDFNRLDVQNIESMSILKDASAAIYGIQAANGVVLISTKAGKLNEKSKINVNSYYGWQNWTRYPRPSTADIWTRAKAYADVQQTMAATGTGTTAWTQSELDKWAAGTEPGYAGTDWYEFAVRDNFPQYYTNINTSGGSDKTTYYISLAYLNQDGAFNEFNYHRVNLQSNIQSQIRKNIKVGLNLSGQMGNINSPGIWGNGDPMWAPMYGLSRNFPIWSPYANNNPKYVQHTDWDESQHALISKDILGWYENLSRNLNTNFFVEYDTPIKGLQARFQYSFGLNQGELDLFRKTWNTYQYDAATDQYLVAGGLTSGSHIRELRQTFNNSFITQLNYKRTIREHNISGTYVFEIRKDETPSTMRVESTPSSNYLELIQFSQVTNFSNTWNSSSSMGHIGKIMYDYNSKYMLELTGRFDAISKFPPGARWGFFPGASAGWRISEESFFKNSIMSRILYNLKLRASYGLMGNASPGNYSAFDYFDGYDYRQGSLYTGGKLIVGTRLRNPGIKSLSWADVKILNIGLDWSTLNGDLSGVVDFFRRDVTGLSAQRYDILIPEELNIILPYENLNAEMQQGFDGMITYQNNRRTFKYSITGNIGYSRAYTTEVYKPRFGNSWDEYRNATEGRFQGITWMYQATGQFKSMEEINSYPINIDGQGNRTLLPGDLKFKDFNNDGLINTLDMRPLGFVQQLGGGWSWGDASSLGLPSLSWGLMTDFTWKGFDMNMSWQGGALMTFSPRFELTVPLLTNANSPEWLLTDNWHVEDMFAPDENADWVEGKYPPLRYNLNSHKSWLVSTFWARNIVYFRLKNLDIGYNVPKKYLKKIGVENLRIYANAYNLFSIDNARQFEIDPEIHVNSGLQNPQQRIINVGFNLTF